MELVAGCDDGFAVGSEDGAAIASFKEHYAKEFPSIRTYDNHQEMLAAENLDIVTVGVSCCPLTHPATSYRR